ncbi:MAG: cytosine permease [Kiritimatiellaeota bacterium]|nr:cytosine permease [Kiritimatiellota bacterium]
MQQNAAVPSYLASAKPNPTSNRAPWYKNTAPTYAGIFLWFVFWSGSLFDKGIANTPGGILSAGVGVALGSVLVAALLCHVGFYYAPALFGRRTGLPLYIVGTSTFGAVGGFLLPGLLMGLLQFGWLAVNTFFSANALNGMIGFEGGIDSATGAFQGSAGLYALMVIWGIAAVVTALKGIKYVAIFSTYLPLIPLGILIVLVAKTIGGLGSFDAAAFSAAHVVDGGAAAMGSFGVFAFALTYIVGFFATAGAAGVDFGTNSRDKKDVAMGGLVGVAGAIFLTIGASILIVAGFYGSPEGQALLKEGLVILNPMELMVRIFGSESAANWLKFALAVTAFPSACFCSLIAANSIRNSFPKVNPWLSCGIGCAVAVGLAITGIAGKCGPVFQFIGASFGPICGAITMEYILCKGRWSGPRAGVNPAGWVAWALGFIVGIQPNFAAYCNGFAIPAAPVAAFIVGAVVYALLSKAQSAVLPYPQAEEQAD